MSKRPFRVYVHDIGPNFSYSTPERAFERVRQLIEEERYATVTLFIPSHSVPDEDPRVLLRRIRFQSDGLVREEIISRRGSHLWQNISKAVVQ